MAGRMRLDGDIGRGLLEALRGADEEVKEAAGKYGLPAAGRAILKAARKKAPSKRKAGAGWSRVKDKRARPLRMTGYVSRIKPNRTYPYWGAAVGFSAYHARLVELGHGGPKPAPPHPYFAPAALAARNEALAAAVDATDRALEKSIRGVARNAETAVRRHRGKATLL